jgi:hypothetical protein
VVSQNIILHKGSKDISSEPGTEAIPFLNNGTQNSL